MTNMPNISKNKEELLMQNKCNLMQKSQREFDKKINKLLAEATILLYEIKAINERGIRR
jgi:hypothetical protein